MVVLYSPPSGELEGAGEGLKQCKMKPTIWLLALLCPLLSMCQSITIRGTVINEEGAPVQGATILLKGTNRSTIADASGRFAIPGTSAKDSITVSAIGYQTITEPNNERGLITITLKRRYTLLDETVVMAYGITSKRFNTGSISKVTASEITTQPVSNPLAALHGRVPGLEITQNSGVPGAAFKILIRGQNSLTQGNEPLFVIDGVPFLNGNTQLNQSSNSAIGGLSPLNSINPADIESIEILKDADATAIYGSRAANGVVLITTKKGKPGKTIVNVSYRAGFSKASSSMNLLSTNQYLLMRREAFANDGIIPTLANAPDLLAWDTTRYTDFKKLFTGGTAQTSDINLSLSGGTATTQFLVSLGHQKETTVFSSSLSGQRTSVHFTVAHTSPNRKFSITAITGYSINKSNLLRSDLTAYINMAPHFPLYDSTGNLNWKAGSVSLNSLGLTNPMAQFRQQYNAEFATLLANTILSYRITQGLIFRISAAMQSMNGNETTLLPRSAIDPSSSQLASANFNTSSVSSIQTEPQIEYSNRWAQFKFTALAGASFQEIINRSATTSATNYTSDILLSTPSAAGAVRIIDAYSQYRYAAAFGRINIRYKETYILNLTGRRDGSSRFGPARRFANFAAIGTAWIFSNEKWVKKNLPFISFGKLRASFGVTGNDQIGDYKFLDTWTSTSATYQGMPALQPSRLFNPYYGWETNSKWEAGLELGFLNDRLLLFASAYQNRSGNQLVNFALPVQTGFSSVQQNFNALIQNKGLELSLTAKNITAKEWEWTTVINFTLSRNKLLAFPDIEKTAYRTVYIVGQPLSVIKTYRYLGIDPSTGIYRFLDVDSNAVMDINDRISTVSTNPSFYGGMLNTIRWRKIELSFFVEYRKQKGKNYLATQSSYIPGYFFFNQPQLVLNRWQHPGDNALVQRYVSATTSPAYRPAQSYLPGSDAIYSDASFIRMKNLSLTYSIPVSAMKKIKAQELSVFIQAQNLFTITNYIGADPENQNLYVLPPLKTWVLGLRLQL